jgi:hypothetical protein
LFDFWRFGAITKKHDSVDCTVACSISILV